MSTRFNPFGWPGPFDGRWAPENLWQPINPGWSFGNLIVNQSNSSAPEIERNVISHHSYGRQLGRLMDAVEALLDAVKPPADDERVREFRELAAKIDAIKRQGACDRIDRLVDELRVVRKADPDGWQRLQSALGR